MKSPTCKTWRSTDIEKDGVHTRMSTVDVEIDQRVMAITVEPWVAGHMVEIHLST